MFRHVLEFEMDSFSPGVFKIESDSLTDGIDDIIRESSIDIVHQLPTLGQRRQGRHGRQGRQGRQGRRKVGSVSQVGRAGNVSKVSRGEQAQKLYPSIQPALALVAIKEAFKVDKTTDKKTKLAWCVEEP